MKDRVPLLPQQPVKFKECTTAKSIIAAAIGSTTESTMNNIDGQPQPVHRFTTTNAHTSETTMTTPLAAGPKKIAIPNAIQL